MQPSVVWFRLDLRLTDNPALDAAIERGGAIVPVFIWSPEEEGAWPPGAASRWWLHQSLQSLDAPLRKRGSRLILRRSPTLGAIRKPVREVGADSVFWNHRYEPALIARDAGIKEALQADGLRVESFHSALLFEPWEIQNAAGKPFQVFTPFWRACMAKSVNVGAASAPRPVAVAFDAFGQSLIITGAVLGIIGWRQIYRGKGLLVNTGLYRRVRHPQ